MSYLVLARKWRPADFSEVVGQEHVTQTLANAIQQGRLAHALLFSGARGVGKTTTARILAKCLNCASGVSASPCGQCPSCKEVAGGSSLDVIEIDGASNNKVEDIREIIDNVRYLPAEKRHKIYIIDEVHMLSTAAFNALLKTLEEPPDRVYFVLATTEPQRIPPTIISRCQRFDFRRVGMAKLEAHLAKLAEREKIEISRYSLQRIARMAGGSVRDSLSLFDQLISYAGEKVSDQTVGEVFGLVDRRLLWEVVEAALAKDRKRCLTAVAELYRKGYDFAQCLRELIEIYRNLLTLRASGSRELCDLMESEVDSAQRLAAVLAEEELLQQYEILRRGLFEVQRAENNRFAFEAVLLKATFAGPFLPAEEILQLLQELKEGPRAAPRPAAPAATPRPEPRQGGETATAVAAEAPTPPAPAKGGELRTVAEQLRQKKPALAALLNGAARWEAERGLLRLAAGPFEKKLLEENETRELLLSTCEAVLGRRPRLEFTSPEEAVASAAAPAALSPSLDREQLLSDPAVKKVREVLGGQVTRVIPPERKG